MIDHDGALERLDALLEGTLPEAERRDVEAHLASCLPCAREMAALADLVARARSLPESVPPSRDLWSGIRERLSEPSRPPEAPVIPVVETPRRRWFEPVWRPALAAAAAAAVFVAAALLVPFGGRPRAPETGLPSAGSRPDLVVVSGEGKRESSGVAQLIWGLEQESAGLGKTVLADLDRNPGPLGEAGVRDIRAGLASLDRAIDDAVTALKQDPDDPALVQRVTDYYRRRIALLEEAARAASVSA